MYPPPRGSLRLLFAFYSVERLTRFLAVQCNPGRIAGCAESPVFQSVESCCQERGVRRLRCNAAMSRDGFTAGLLAA